jgi:hypothetical protein
MSAALTQTTRIGKVPSAGLFGASGDGGKFHKGKSPHGTVEIRPEFKETTDKTSKNIDKRWRKTQKIIEVWARPKEAAGDSSATLLDIAT